MRPHLTVIASSPIGGLSARVRSGHKGTAAVRQGKNHRRSLDFGQVHGRAPLSHPALRQRLHMRRSRSGSQHLAVGPSRPAKRLWRSKPAMVVTDNRVGPTSMAFLPWQQGTGIAGHYIASGKPHLSERLRRQKACLSVGST